MWPVSDSAETGYFWYLAQSRHPRKAGLDWEHRVLWSRFQFVTSWDEFPADKWPPEREAALLLWFHQKNKIQGPESRIRFPKPGESPSALCSPEEEEEEEEECSVITESAWWVTQDANSFPKIKGPTILEITRCPSLGTLNTILLYNVIRMSEECLALLDNNQGWFREVKVFYCVQPFRLQRPWETKNGFKESQTLLPVQQVF